MAETFEQYLARIGSYAAGKDPMRILRQTPRVLTRAVELSTPRRLKTRPLPGTWSAGEVLAHLSEIELLWGYRIRLILGQPGVPIAGMDEKTWARNSDYRSIDPVQSLALFRALRRANLRLLSGLSPRQRASWGAHSQFGRLTISRIVRLVAGHDINHRRQVQDRAARNRRRIRD